MGLLLAADTSGKLVQRMGEIVDGEYQKYSVEKGSYIREHFFSVDPELQSIVNHLSDEQIQKMRRGGHDPEKVTRHSRRRLNTAARRRSSLPRRSRGMAWVRRVKDATSPISRRS